MPDFVAWTFYGFSATALTVVLQKKSFLRAGVQPPMSMEEHAERLEELYSKVADSKQKK